MNLYRIYSKLLDYFGQQYWWPAETKFEVVVGAILTQNAAWKNVEKAIENLKEKGVLNLEEIRQMDEGELAKLIKPAGYFNQKARRLKLFVDFVYENYGGVLDHLFQERDLRNILLSLWGIGEETADAIALYAAEVPEFVVDSYTRRVFSRYGIFKGDESYAEIKRYFEANFVKEKNKKNIGLKVQAYKEFHALIDELAKQICTKRNRSCHICPISRGCMKVDYP